MITLKTSESILVRGSNMYISPLNRRTTNIQFIDGEYTIIQNTFRGNDGEQGLSSKLTFYTSHVLSSRRVTTPVLFEVISNSSANLLLEYKEAWYLVGKNLICSYDL